MTTSSFDQFVKQNVNEFNKEYAKYEEKNSIKILNKADEIKSRRTIGINCISETKTTSKIIPCETKNTEILKCQYLKNSNIGTMNNKIMKYVYGYCFSILRKGICTQPQCKYKRYVSILFYYFTYI